MDLRLNLVCLTCLLVAQCFAAKVTTTTEAVPQEAEDAVGPTTTLAAGVTSKPTTTPTVIACFNGKCVGNCSTFNNATCSSDTLKGCKTVIDSSKTPTEYTFSCGPTPDADCKKDGASCCYKDKCNSYTAATKSKSAASTIVGNLMSLTLISLLAYYI